MNEDLKSALEQYKNCTVRLIENLEQDNFDALGNIIDDRQRTIDIMDNMSYSQEEFKNTAEAMDITVLEKKLNGLINEKKQYMRRELERVSIERKANKSYNKFYKNAVLLNRKI